MLTQTLSVVKVRRATTNSEVLSARRMHGRRYLEAGHVDRLSPLGTIDDEYVDRSIYLLAEHPRTGELVGTCRLVTSVEHRFPMLDHMTLDEEWDDRLRSTPSTAIAEVSGLATSHRDLGHFSISAALCRTAFHLASTEMQWKYLICVVDATFLRALNHVLHIGLRVAGPSQQYMGETLPTVFAVEDYILRAREHRDPSIDYFTDGLDIDELADAIIDLREERARVVRRPG